MISVPAAGACSMGRRGGCVMVARGQGEGDKVRDRAECDGGYGMTAQGSVRMWIQSGQQSRSLGCQRCRCIPPELSIEA